MACDMPEPCEFPSLDILPEEIPVGPKEVDLVPHLVTFFLCKDITLYVCMGVITPDSQQQRL